MSAINPTVARMAAVNAAARNVRDYAGSDANKALITLIDLIVADYKCDLVNVAVEGLPALQAQVRQLEALRSLAGGAPNIDGRI